MYSVLRGCPQYLGTPRYCIQKKRRKCYIWVNERVKKLCVPSSIPGGTTDTITQCAIPLTYLIPQVKNPTGNIIIDTLNWIQVSGTFTATGNEKYLIIGNFESDVNVNSTFINGTNSGVWTDAAFDDISVIPINLSAYAGPNQNIILGDSAFIGRPPEIGLECTWTNGTTTVGAGGGIWVKPPLGTYTYVVTQNICGNVKTDTVIVNVGPNGINENEFFASNVTIYPQPSKDLVNISLNYYYEPTIEITITDVNGRAIRNSVLTIRNGKTQIEISELTDGVYVLQIISKNQIAQKRLVIAR